MELLSLVIPCHNEAEVLSSLHERLGLLRRTLHSREIGLEAILVDDGSSDDTWRSIEALCREHAWYVGVRLSRNFGQQPALRCGLEHARGDAVISLDADLQDPPEVIPELLVEWRRGADIVFAVRRTRRGESLFKRSSAWIFYRFLHALRLDYIRLDAGDFRLVSKRVCNVICSMREPGLVIREAVGWTGFPSAHIYYDREPRCAGRSGYSLFMMARLAFATISVSSNALLASFLTIAITLCIVAIIGASAAALRLSMLWHVSLIGLIAMGGLCIITCQALVAAYVWKVYELARARPLFIIETVLQQRIACSNAKSEVEEVTSDGGMPPSAFSPESGVA